MRNFAIQNGDLVLGHGGFQAVSGTAKVRQDLGIALREPLGCDRFHPRWGSVLPNFVGEPITKRIGAQVEAEVYRVVRNYMATKANQMQTEFLRGQKASLTADEVVVNITKVDVAWNMDRLFIRVSLETAGGGNTTLVTSVEA